MPRYKYQCNTCQIETTIYHGISEVILNCDVCDGKECMQKLLSKPRYIKKKTMGINQKVGELTKKYIEENKEILKQQQKEAKKQTYDPS